MLATDLSPFMLNDLYINASNQCLDPRFIGFRFYYSVFGSLIQPTAMIDSIGRSLSHPANHSDGYSVESILMIGGTSLFAVMVWLAQLFYVVFLLPRIGRFQPTRWVLGEGVDTISRHPQYMLAMVLIFGPLLGVTLDWAFMSPIGLFVVKHIGLEWVILIRQMLELADWVLYIIGGWLFY